MVINSSSTFLSRFNSCVKHRSRTFQVPVTKFTSSILSLIYSEGYVLYYFTQGNAFVAIVNHRSVDFTLKEISRVSRPVYFNVSNLSKNRNSGFRFIVQSSSGGFFFSDSFNLKRLGGRALYRLSQILCNCSLQFFTALSLILSIILKLSSTTFFLADFLQLQPLFLNLCRLSPSSRALSSFCPVCQLRLRLFIR